MIATTPNNSISSTSSSLAKTLASTIKRRILSRLPWVNKNKSANKNIPPSPSKDLDSVINDRPWTMEEDENALNEALEARLAEVIARAAPLPESEPGHLRVTLGLARVNHYYEQVEGDFEDDLVMELPRAQTRCQKPEAQTK